MAFVTEIAPAPVAERSTNHKECVCGWRVVERDGERVLQLDTYGSADRKIHGKVSQSLQFDRQHASELLRLIEKTFPGIR